MFSFTDLVRLGINHLCMLFKAPHEASLAKIISTTHHLPRYENEEVN